MLSRARRRVIAIDSGQPRNARAAGVHGFLTREGTPPAELLSRGRVEVRAHGGVVIDGHVVSASGDQENSFTVTLEDGRTFRAHKLLFTTGLTDELPHVPGLRSRWGLDVLHCPYCHGWEFRDREIGILATSRFAAHQAQQFRQWTPHVTLLLHQQTDLTPDDGARLAARGIRVQTGEVTNLIVKDDHLRGVRIAGDQVVPLHALAISPRFLARSEALAGLGVHPEPHPLGAEVGEFITTDPFGRTAVPGVWAAGNVTDLQSQVLNAAAAGARAATAINAELIEEDIARALLA